MKEENEKQKELKEQNEYLNQIEKEFGKEKKEEMKNKLYTSFIYQPPPGYQPYSKLKDQKIINTMKKPSKNDTQSYKTNKNKKELLKLLNNDPINNKFN